MNAKNINDILDALALRFGTTASHLWGILVRQVYVDAITSSLLILTSSVLFAYLLKKFIKSYDGGNGDDDVYIPLGFGAFIIGIIAAAIFAFCIGDITQCFNPEYGALQTILRAVGK